MNEPDPGATFRADQAAAAQEASSREQATWDMHVRHQEVGDTMAAACAEKTQAQANFWSALGLLVLVVTIVAAGAGVCAFISWVTA